MKDDRDFSVGHLQLGLQNRAIKGAGFSVSSQIVSYAVQVIGTIVLARLLSPALFGLVAMVESVSLLLQNFGFNGITEAVVQSEDLTHGQLSKLFWLYTIAMIALTLGFIAVSPHLALFFREPQIKRIAPAIACTIFLGGLSTCHLAVLTRSMKFDVIALIQVLASCLSTGSAIVLALAGFGIWALVLRRIFMQLCLSGFAWFFCRWRPILQISGEQVGDLVRFSLRTYLTYLVDYIRKSADKILIGRVLGSVALGHYDRAYQLAGVLPNQLTASLSGVSLASLSRLKDDHEKYLILFSKSLSVISLVAFPASALLALVGRDLILLLLGPQWDEAGKIFSALGPSVGSVIVYYAIYWLHFSLGRADRLLRWSTFALIISLAAYALGIIYGALGVAIAYSLLFYVLLIPALCYAGRPLGVKARFFLSILWKYWFAAFVAAACCIGMSLLSGISIALERMGHLTRIAAVSGLFSGVYILLIIILFHGIGPLALLFSVVKRFLSPAPGSRA